jgi:tetraacyldisaccharide 4'-kinase
VRNALYDATPTLSQRATRPVISIGGISAGGTGKTPLTLLIGEYLIAKHCGVAILSRGYRRTDTLTRIVAPGDQISWETIGDEPWLLHHRLPAAWLGVDARRIRAARLLASRMPDRSVFLLDDGFQHRALHRDLDIVSLHQGVTQDRMIPAGYLREPFSSLKRAHIAVLIGSPDELPRLEQTRDFLVKRFPTLPWCIMTQQPGEWHNLGTGKKTIDPPLNRPVLISGIARPERFIAMVRRAGITPCKELIFSDHHRYIRNDFIKTRELYSNGFVTTEKDAVRIQETGILPADHVWYLSIKLCFVDKESEQRLYGLIDKHTFPL